MFMEKSIAVVVPAYNEETQIGRVITTMPVFIDHIVIIDDLSKDKTSEVVAEYAAKDKRVHLIRHSKNQGVGGSIATGYKWARDHNIDVAVVMAGDGQMNPDELPNIIHPVCTGEVDYAKANRLVVADVGKKVPAVRLFGNAVLSFLTKIASGYWHVVDSQTGYTAISQRALKTIDWDKMYQRYGMPNDLLVRLNIYDFKVRDVRSEPVYDVGEQSKLKVRKVVFTISALLIRLFFYRLKEKYVIRQFHPLVLFYGLGFVSMALAGIFTVRLIILWSLRGQVPELTFMTIVFTVLMGLQSLGFAMFFDFESNKDLR